jgi:hypothetical protein
MQWADRKKIAKQYIEMVAEDKLKALALLVPGEAPITGGSSGSGAGPASAGARASHRPVLQGISGKMVMFITCFAACADLASASPTPQEITYPVCAGSAFASVPEPAAPAMPVWREVSRKAQRKHRVKTPEHDCPFNVCVARPVQGQEKRINPKA